MLNSTILDVAIGLIFIFLAVSLAAGAIVEAFASLFNLRSKTLKYGIMDLVNDPRFNDLAAKLYTHALISPRGPGPGRVPPAGATKLPSYIQPKQFAEAFMDVLSLLQAVPTVAALQAAVDAQVPESSHPQINQLLKGIILRTGGDLKAIRDELAGWFDNAMDGLSGVYKRYTQLLVFVAALAICAGLNVDALHLAQRIWAQPSLMADLKVGNTPQETANLDWQLAQSLPLGWTDFRLGSVQDPNSKTVATGRSLGLAIIGWLITAFASLFGAPFWFDTLQRVTRLKGAGPSPDEKADKTAAAT